MPSKEVGERAIHLTEANLQRCAQVAGNQLKASSSGREVIGVLLAWLPPPIRVGTVAQYVPATVDDHYQGAIIPRCGEGEGAVGLVVSDGAFRSEEHTSELQSRGHLVCRLLLEKK